MALIHVHFYSNTIGRGVSCDVILPQTAVNQIGMESRANERTKTLYLLHGMSDDHTIWQRRTAIERYVSPLGLAVVMPGAELSGYSNMAHGGRYFDFVANELPEVMNGFFGLSLNREDNFICGLSMGGEGAMKIGLARSDRFSAIGCLSSGIRVLPIPEDTSSIDQSAEWYSPYMFNRFDGRVIEGSEEDTFEIARKLVADGSPLPRIYHSTGRQDFVRYQSDLTRDFFNSFEGNPFGYRFDDDEGEHTWEYWDEHIQRFLQFITE